MGPLATIKAQIPALANPATAGSAAVAIDRAYRQLWADVHDLGTLFTLRQGLLARNLLYEGNTVAHIYKLLKTQDPSIKDPKTATALLSILAAILTDVPAAFAAEGYGDHIHEVMDEGELIVPDTNELNAMRAQPLFVTLALDTLLDRPESSDHDPHVCVGYLNDIISMDSVDATTNTAVQRLLEDSRFRASLFRGLCDHDPHKLFKCLQILKRCLGGGPRVFRGLQPEPYPTWTLQRLLQYGAEQPLVTVCNTVATMVKEHQTERQLLGLLHTTLLDVFELLCAEDDSNSSSSSLVQQQQQRRPSATTAAAAAHGNAGTRSDSSSRSSWTDALIAAHVELVVEVARLVPFLVTTLSRMRPYMNSTAACLALHQLGVQESIAALVAVLEAGDPTDWLVLQQEVEAYQVLDALCRQDPHLASAAAAAGAPRTIHAALLEWAQFLPLPSNADDAVHDHEDLSVHSALSIPHTDFSLHSQQSSDIFEVEVLLDKSNSGAAPPPPPAAAAADIANAAAAAGFNSSNGIESPETIHASHSAVGQVDTSRHRNKFVDPLVAAAVTAAMQLLLTLLLACSCPVDNSKPSSSAPDKCRSSSTSNSNSSSNEQPDAGPNAGGSAPCDSSSSSSPTSLLVLCRQQGLPHLLVEIGQLEIFEPLALDCLSEIDRLGLLPQVLQDLLEAAAAAAAAGVEGNSVGDKDVIAETAAQGASTSSPPVSAAAITNGLSSLRL